MKPIHYIVMALGLLLFFYDSSWGWGWLVGWLALILLKQFREPLLERIIDFDDFSIARYIGYLVIVIFWIALPLLVAFVKPEWLNPFAIFAAYLIDRFIMFLSSVIRKE